MSKNTLFNFITFVDYQKLGLLFLDAVLNLSKNKDNQPYYHFNLPINKDSSISFLNSQLTSHHISIYEQQKASNPSLSQYHYTAYFLDDAGKEYQLHVYFNDKDELASLPVFSIKGEKGYQKCTADNLNLSFIHLANKNTKPIISLLRSQHLAKKDELTNKYIQLEQEASDLSVDLHNKTYFHQLEALQELLCTLDKLVDNDEFQKKFRSIERFKNTLQQKTDFNSIEEQKERQQPISNCTYVARTKKEKASKKKPTAFKELTNQLAQLNRLVTELEHSQQPLSEARQVKLLNEIYIQVTSIELTFFGNTPKAVTATANQLAQLRSSHNILNKWGQPLLFNLLLKNEFELAAELKPFHSALSLKYLNMALATNNAALLTFLLTYGQYPISNLVITIGGKTYPSAIHFCFEQQKRGKVMFDAVTTLVKHNASSLLLTNEDGMPLIYAILKEAEHPFREILYKNHYDLSGSKSFLESLVASLFDCLFQPNLREETRHEIAQRLEYYQLILQILENDIQVFGEKVGRELSEKRALCNNRLISQEMINRIQLDPDVIALAKESYEKESICFKMLNSKGRVQEAFFKKKRLESVEINNSKNLDFASLKKILLDSMKNNLSSFDNLIQCKEQLKPIRQEKISIGINKNSLFYEEVSRMSSAERISLQKQLQEGRAF